LFFAYQHYGESFLPDYVLVGKGLFLSSIVMVKRPCSKVDAIDDTDDSTQSDENDIVVEEDESADNDDDDTNRRSLLSSSSSSTPMMFLSPYHAEALATNSDEFREHVTFECNAVMFLQAAVLLERIDSGKLIQNARVTGEHILQRLQLIEQSLKLPQSDMVYLYNVQYANDVNCTKRSMSHIFTDERPGSQT
jgi:hypothetical protein